MPGHIHFHPADAQGIAHVVISHPGKLNALDIAMWHDLRSGFDAIRQAARPPRAVIVRGEGGSFVAGGDIEEFPRFRFDPATLADFHEETVAPALEAMLACDVPLIAQIDGACIGGGLEIAACCDLRLCGESSRFGVPIAKLGFPMAPREIEIVARVVGETVLRELLLEARVLKAEEARQRGLVTRVLPDGDVAADALRTAQRIAELSPQAMRLNKQALRRFTLAPASNRAERAPHYAYAPSAEHREGLAAFNEKRPARFLDPDDPARG
ncbi:enoyl-CoA hydratase/isomerase family protein [Ideonella sp. B7]|uniref:enoyl-CoA hydratase/isomerase family protein n=1 Tax=Ideonella benzenivorans TaxID=2831643 RepID=UPI001CEC752F|nr:enoyl-CoA hydratase/isomerase family protein [Ideonella benzenivorans]MCA6218793.1 enoyl-CoA hydratase/isomerase family protein [Ideonella benzenivorans]